MSTRFYFILSVVVLSLAFVGCSETKEQSKYDNWRERNEAFIDSLQQVVDNKTDPDLYFVVDQRNKSQKIFFKKIRNEEYKTDERRPLLTSKVKVYYRGMLINEGVFAATPSPKFYTTQYEKLDVFDGNISGPDPTEFDTLREFSVNGVIAGWIEVLQWMYPGERWEIYIPWQSAYGSSGTTTIPGYSALVFDLYLYEISDYSGFE